MAENYTYIHKSFTYDGHRYKVRGKTEEEAILKKAQLLADLKAGKPVRQNAKARKLSKLTTNTSVEDYAEVWLSTYVRPKVRKPGAEKSKHTMTEKSYQCYVDKLNLYILPAIGKMKMRDVNEMDLQCILNASKNAGLSQSHGNKLRMVMGAMFSRAVSSRIIDYNPTENLEVTVEDGDKRRSLTDIERFYLLETAAEHRCGLWIRFLLATGLRPAESAPLLVSDIDWVNKTVHISKAIESGTEYVIGPPKSKAGIRTVPIPDHVFDDLLASVKEKRPNDYVFPQTNGNSMMTTTCMQNNWRSFSRQMDLRMGAETTAHGHIYDPGDVDKNGVPLYPDENGNPRNGHKIAPDLVLYNLRHTYCTDLEKAGVSVYTAKILMGHEDIRITAKIYMHCDPEVILAARDKINAHNLASMGQISGTNFDSVCEGSNPSPSASEKTTPPGVVFLFTGRIRTLTVVLCTNAIDASGKIAAMTTLW